jgi:hypothetical protein
VDILNTEPAEPSTVNLDRLSVAELEVMCVLIQRAEGGEPSPGMLERALASFAKEYATVGPSLNGHANGNGHAPTAA